MCAVKNFELWEFYINPTTNVATYLVRFLVCLHCDYIFPGTYTMIHLETFLTAQGSGHQSHDP